MQTKRLVVFASGSGTNFQNLIDRFHLDSTVPVDIVGLIASKEGIKSIDRAKNAQIPVVILPSAKSNPMKFEDLMKRSLNSWKPDLIVLAGFLRLIPPSVIKDYANKIINIHPSLLPKFGGKGMFGMRVHEAVIKANENKSGCTVHYVTEAYDEGAIIAQEEVGVAIDETAESLAAKILTKEHQLLAKVVHQILLP